MQFKKYQEIVNDYKNVVEKLVNKVPHLQVIVQEKLDGANFSVYIDKKGMKFARRTAFLSDNEKFYNWQKVKPTCEYLRELLSEYEDGIILYGELFGKGIQNRINYGDSIYIQFYDMCYIKDNKRYWLSPEQFYELMRLYNLLDLALPIMHSTTMTLKEALEIDIENISSIYSPTNDNIEGIIIRPYKEIKYWGDYLNNNELKSVNAIDRIIIKKKAEKFKEKTKSKKNKKEIPAELKEWQDKVKEYLNENRVLSCFSKEGEIQNEKQIGKYIKLIMKDIKKDIFDDYPEVQNMNKKELKVIFSPVNKEIVKYLQKYL